jgi:hypothetical protein
MLTEYLLLIKFNDLFIYFYLDVILFYKNKYLKLNLILEAECMSSPLSVTLLTMSSSFKFLLKRLFEVNALAVWIWIYSMTTQTMLANP